MVNIVGVVASDLLQIQSEGIFAFHEITLTSLSVLEGLPFYLCLGDWGSYKLAEQLKCVIKFNIRPPPLQKGEFFVHGRFDKEIPYNFDKVIIYGVKRLEQNVLSQERVIKGFCSGVSLTEQMATQFVFETKLAVCPPTLENIPVFIQNQTDRLHFIEFCKELKANKFVDERVNITPGDTVCAFPVEGILMNERWGISHLLKQLPTYRHVLQITPVKKLI